MHTYCTYCSAEKHLAESSVPAIELYNSARISRVFETAKQANKSFLILSGKYGVVEPNEKISYYDHLLTTAEIENHSDLIASQLKTKKVTSVEFYMNSVASDQNLQAYKDCISMACTKASIPLKIKVQDFPD